MDRQHEVCRSEAWTSPMRFERCTSGELLRSGPARAQDSVTARQRWRILTLGLAQKLARFIYWV